MKSLCQIYSLKHEDGERKAAPLEPLEEAMHCQFEERQTPARDGSKVLPIDQLNAELFYPQRLENVETTEPV